MAFRWKADDDGPIIVVFGSTHQLKKIHCQSWNLSENLSGSAHEPSAQVNSDIHFANSGNPDETALYEPSHQDFYLWLLNLIFIPVIKI